MWTELQYEAKSQSNIMFTVWANHLMSNSVITHKTTHTGIKKVLNLLKSLAINKRDDDIEFLIIRWSMESHIFIAT